MAKAAVSIKNTEASLSASCYFIRVTVPVVVRCAGCAVVDAFPVVVVVLLFSNGDCSQLVSSRILTRLIYFKKTTDRPGFESTSAVLCKASFLEESKQDPRPALSRQ